MIHFPVMYLWMGQEMDTGFRRYNEGKNRESATVMRREHVGSNSL